MKSNHNRGGTREGAGPPVKYKGGVKSKTFRLPVEIAKHIEQQPNSTRYLIDLVEADIKLEGE